MLEDIAMDESAHAGRRLIQFFDTWRGRARDDLAASLADQWSPECLARLLDSPERRVVCAAAQAIGLIGRLSDQERLAALLHHADPSVAQSAEDAMWSLWFRDGGPIACAVLTRLARSVDRGDTENVIPLLNDLIRTHPTFAEAFHQRSQVYYLDGAHEESLRDARRAVALNPLHFAALATLGHCHAALGRFSEAIRIYDQVLRIHPAMSGIRQTLQAVRGQRIPAGMA